jgi:hypothetical protein
MTNGIWSVGSVTDFVGNLVGWTNIPVGISGTTFSNLVEQVINYCELYATVTITSSAIPEVYQPAIIDLSHSKLLFAIEANNGGIGNVSLGELTIGAGNSGYVELAKQLREDGDKRLHELQRTIRTKRVIGGY